MLNPVILMTLLVTTGLVFSCGSPNDSSWATDLDTISELNCQAMQLREARFSLADSMRPYQDSLINYGASLPHRKEHWESSLAVMNQRKDLLADSSRNLSDTIRVELQKLTKDLTVEEKRVFNDSLRARTDKLDCL